MLQRTQAVLRLILSLKHMCSIFKQHYLYFYVLFHRHMFSHIILIFKCMYQTRMITESSTHYTLQLNVIPSLTLNKYVKRYPTLFCYKAARHPTKPHNKEHKKMVLAVGVVIKHNA